MYVHPGLGLATQLEFNHSYALVYSGVCTYVWIEVYPNSGTLAIKIL